MGVINAGMKKLIKVMAVSAQTAQFISLLPKPKDFVTRVVGDVVYLSSRVIKLSDDMNRLLDSYSDIPTNYLMTQMNSITGSLASITDRVSIYGQNAVNQVVGLGENATNMVAELTGTAIDTAGALSSAIASLGAAVAESSANVLGQTDIGEDIHDATEVVLEWTGDGFKNINTRATDPLRKVTQKLVDYRTGVTNNINDKANAAKDNIEESRLWVEKLITELREKMDKLCNVLDTGFKDVTGLDSVSRGASKIAQELTKEDDNSPASQATSAMAGAVASVIKNFNIGKMAIAFTGVLTQSAIVKLGLDKLPPIDFESMMCKIRNDLTVTSKELYQRYNDLTDSTYNNLIEFGEEAAKIPPEERSYSSKNYDGFVDEFEERLRAKRDEIRLMMKNTTSVVDRTDRNSVIAETQKKEVMRSAIQEVDDFRKKIRNARWTNNMRSVLGEELMNFKKETEYRCNSLKADWQSMMNQYSKALKEIKMFFSNGGSCDMFINDCCEAINHDFDEIKSLCKNLLAQLVGSTVKVVLPADIVTGMAVPNPAYKIADFLMDIKTILKFIKDLITLIIDIINHINKLARIMLNGINSLAEIIKQLMDIVGLRWLMNLIQSVIDLFGDNIMNSRERLQNMLSPVHFNETEEYNNALEALEEFIEGDSNKMTTEGKAYLSEVSTMLKDFSDDDIHDLFKDINSTRNKTSFNKKDKEKVEDLIDDFEEQGDFVVAYKSPIIKELGPEDSTPVASMVNGVDLENDIKFIGWHFFHPNLDHTGSTYYSPKFMKKIKGRIIKKASKKSHKKSGGINRLKKKNVGLFKKKDKAYVAFYWYTYYTEDLEKDCFEMNATPNSIIIDNVVHTENGSVVELTDGRKVFVADNMVKSGDYVNVDGVKYRVK